MKGVKVNTSRLLFIRFSSIRNGEKERLEKKLATIRKLQPKLTHLLPYLYVGSNQHFYYLIIDNPGYESLNQAIANKHFEVTEFNICSALKGIIRTLTILHKAGISHGQITPSRIIVHSNFFYLLDPCTGLEQNSELLEDHEYRLYAAPEVLKGETPSLASDIWSLGALIYYLITGHPVYSETSISEYLDTVNAEDPPFKEPIWKKVSPELIQILKKMLKKCEHRITMSELVNSSWLNITGLTKTTNLMNYIKILRNELSSQKIIKTFLYVLANEVHEQRLEDLLSELQSTDFKNSGKVSMRFLLEKVLDPEHRSFNALKEKNLEVFYKDFIESCIDLNKLLALEKVAAVFHKYSKSRQYIEKDQIKIIMKECGFSDLLGDEIKLEEDIKLAQKKKRDAVNLTFDEFTDFFEEKKFNFSEEIILN
jgi:serine/threonine protein kinase